jgi:FkbM family methyltransferase
LVYSFGVGEDVSFDLELIRRFDVQLHAFDPTPRSIEWLKTQELPSAFKIHEYGIADFDGTCEFFPPSDPAHISHTSLAGSRPLPPIKVPVHRLATIMQMLGHERIELLKMDIEGAEYDVIADMLSDGIEVRQLLVEFHHRWPQLGINKTRRAVQMLNKAGYRLFNISPSGEEYSFMYVDN